MKWACASFGRETFTKATGILNAFLTVKFLTPRFRPKSEQYCVTEALNSKPPSNTRATYGITTLCWLCLLFITSLPLKCLLSNEAFPERKRKQMTIRAFGYYHIPWIVSSGLMKHNPVGQCSHPGEICCPYL